MDATAEAWRFDLFPPDALNSKQLSSNNQAGICALGFLTHNIFSSGIFSLISFGGISRLVSSLSNVHLCSSYIINRSCTHTARCSSSVVSLDLFQRSSPTQIQPLGGLPHRAHDNLQRNVSQDQFSYQIDEISWTSKHDLFE